MKKRMVPFVFIILLTVLIAFIAKFLLSDTNPKIVVVLDGLETEYSKTVKAGIEKGVADFNMDGKVIAPDSYSASKQNAILEDVLKQKPDALIITPIEPSVTIPVLTEYEKRKIPVLMLNKDAQWKDQTLFIGTDHLELGKMAGAILSSLLYPGDQVVFMVDSKTDSAVNDRIKGAKEVLESVDIEVMIEQLESDKTAHMSSEMSNMIQTHPTIKGLFATNDIIALDALKVIEEKGLHIPVIGTDGTMGMLQAVEKETLSITLSQNPFDMGYLSVEKALKASKGEHVEQKIDSGVDIVTTSNAKSRIDFLAKNVLR
ncbi:sugar ABC transporter substrate-binding protein [Metabacillus rhizolycopersici]|uniref:Sugar ABC transporter substrate-binding protein n=1 Tax=Metabacillus rhizolycopersici TaxID=2875709 RepID=A0ABS7UKR5_9BACI|nr:sugar ABC transporter substrate-binding protein [Metabacillus rhizolycopersici]MBZ5748910.1 sugar ABC transporter substrate-binding protein [Metabacillus rhizolycopersici]